MAKKKEQLTPERANPEPLETAEAASEPQPKYFTRAMWKNTLEVFKCVRCSEFRNTKDEMIDHILLHYPREEQERVLEELVLEK